MHVTREKAAKHKRASTYKSITSGLPRLAVGDDHRLLDVPEHLEVLPQARVGGVVGQPPDEDLGERGVLLCRVHGAPPCSSQAVADKSCAFAGGVTFSVLRLCVCARRRHATGQTSCRPLPLAMWVRRRRSSSGTPVCRSLPLVCHDDFQTAAAAAQAAAAWGEGRSYSRDGALMIDFKKINTYLFTHPKKNPT